VPYRDLHKEQKRAQHLAQFCPHMVEFLGKQTAISEFQVFIVEQSDDNRKFNRGKLLNIGFDIARNHSTAFDVFVYHDVDLLPGDDLGPYYATFPTTPIHIARCWDRYSNNPKYFGGIVSFSAKDMRAINGFPNTFWGWGGEDDEMQVRSGEAEGARKKKGAICETKQNYCETRQALRKTRAQNAGAKRRIKTRAQTDLRTINIAAVRLLTPLPPLPRLLRNGARRTRSRGSTRSPARSLIWRT